MSKWVYAIVLVVGLGLLAVARFYRLDSSQAPLWLGIAAIIFLPIAIWVDVWSRRRKRD